MHDKPDEEEEVVAERGGVRAFDMPELIHNLNLLVDMTEEDIVLNERRYGIVILEDTVVNEWMYGVVFEDIVLNDQK